MNKYYYLLRSAHDKSNMNAHDYNFSEHFTYSTYSFHESGVGIIFISPISIFNISISLNVSVLQNNAMHWRYCFCLQCQVIFSSDWNSQTFVVFISNTSNFSSEFLTMNNCYFLKGSLDGTVLVHLNFMYSKKRELASSASQWRCRRKCPVYIVLQNDEIVSVSDLSKHSHCSEEAEIKVLQFKYNLRIKSAANPHIKPLKLYR